MERLTKDNPQENFETMMNYVFVKDGWAHIRHDGESENVPLTTWAKAQCIKRGCDDFQGKTAKEIDETLCDCLMDGEGCPMALAYCFACQASHLRDRLKVIEDILGDVYDLDHLREIARAEKDGRLVVQDVFALWPIECDVCERNVDGHGCKGLEDAIDDSRPGAEWPFMAKNCPKQVYRVHTTSERLQLARERKADIDGIRYFLTKQDAEEALREETENA